MRQLIRTRLCIFACSLILLSLMSTRANAQTRGRMDQFTKDTISQSEKILASVTDRKSLREAVTSANQLGDYVSAHAGTRQLDAMVRSESVLSILTLVSISKHGDPQGVIEQFSKLPGFMTELGLLVGEQDMPSEVVRVAMDLMTKRGAQVEQFPALAAAICVVHDLREGSTYTTRVNENNPVGPEPIAIFDFFVSNARTMYISPDKLPALDLVFVVDVAESVDQLQWAHKTYRTSPGIDQRFFEIMYDYEHYQQGKTKKVTAAGDYSLQQIKKYGGVCADQAYFAMSVAKACGIPSGYVVAKGADVSHAWVGYLEVRGRRANWNFEAGRYPDYQNLRGNMLNPQTGEMISDGRVGILGGAVTATTQQVHHAMAAGRVVDRMNKGYWRPVETLELDRKGNAAKARTDSVGDRLTLLRMTLNKCAGVPRTWDEVTVIARSGDMSQKDLDTWSRAIIQIAGRTHQDFSFDFLVDLISTVDDPKEQHDMWEWAFGQFRARPDLAAAVRFQQGELWDANNNPEYAWISYKDVLDNFLNDGPMSDDALSAMGKMLTKNGKREAYLQLLQDTARKVNRPEDMASNFAKQSNYYKVHWRLVKELEYHNRNGEAKQIRDMIKMPAKD